MQFPSLYVQLYLKRLNSQGTEIFPFSYFANPWLECEKVRKDIKNINNFRKTRTNGLNFGWESCNRNHDWHCNNDFHFSPKREKWRSKRHLSPWSYNVVFAVNDTIFHMIFTDKKIHISVNLSNLILTDIFLHIPAEM